MTTTAEMLSVRAAELYYEENKTQDEIGSLLGLTRWKVGRLLTQARALGIVRIEIVHPRARKLSMERELCERFSLVDAVIVSSPGDGSSVADRAMALSVAVNPGFRSGQALDNSGVDHRVLHVRLLRGRIEKSFENIGFHPVSKPLEDRVPAAELGRKVAPGAAGPRNPQHRLDEPAVIRAAAARVRLLPPAMRFHFRPLGIAQHISVHPKLESQYLAWGNPKSQQTLEHDPFKSKRTRS